MTGKLKQAEGLFRLAVEAAPNAMIVADQEGRIVLVNSQTEGVFGYGRQELLGQPLEILIPHRFRAKHSGYVQDFFTHPKTRAMGAGRDLYGLRKDGTELPVEIGLNPFSTPQGRFVLASIIDITERRMLQKKLAQAELLAAVGGMVTMVAHEIRNPLGSIVMGAKAIARGDLAPDDKAQAVSVLVNESERLNRTLADFLQFARPRELKLVKGDLNATTREVLAAARADPRIVGDTQVRESLDERLPPVHFDADQIRQVLWNILRNAFQALGGKGRLEVETETRSQDAAVHIRDTGPGIPRDHLEKIFVPFFTTKAQGTGLGLSTSRNIVLAHGGDIAVESEPGKGSRFSILLPLKRP